jgi:uncharacterized protein YjbI with pentapeptide repeats
LALRHASNATDIARICYQLLRLATAQLPREFLKEKRFRGSLDIVDSSWVGYDGGQYVRDEELSVWQTKPERGQKEETKQSRWGFHGKTVWDFLQLLIVPLMLVAIGLVFSLQQDARQQRVEDQRADAERELADQRAQDEALQAYLDQMSGLLLEKDLRTSEVNSEVRTLAQVRTLTVLGRLDPSRKTAVMQFLVDADLVQSIDERDPIISLNGADLSGANVSDANLRNADLNGADLNGADLSEADLSEADLSFADLANADLSFADLSFADLKGASLSDVDLRGSILRDANLSVAILRGADLSDAYLRGVDLSDANLIGSDLSDAYLKGADLSDAYLGGADLSGRHGTMVDGAVDEAILTVRQCSEADASVDPLEERIYEIMPQMPEEIRLGETERAGLLVSPLTIDEVSESDTSCVELADRMKAQLVPLDLEKSGISRQHPDNDDIQELSSNRVTRWGWDITARQTGKLELILDLRYAISPEGQEFRQVPQSPVYEGAIRVTTEQPSP